MRTLRLVFLVVTILLVVDSIVQLYLAGVGAFSHDPEEGFSWHGTNGRIVLPILVLLTILFAALARAGKRTIWLSVALFGLLVFQTLVFILTGLIFAVGPDTPNPPIAAVLMVSLHAVGGLAMIWVASLVTRSAAALTRASEAAAPQTVG